LAAGLRPPGSLQRSPDPLAGFQGRGRFAAKKDRESREGKGEKGRGKITAYKHYSWIRQCVLGRRHGVDWGGHVHPTFARGRSWDWCKSGEFLLGMRGVEGITITWGLGSLQNTDNAGNLLLPFGTKS